MLYFAWNSRQLRVLLSTTPPPLPPPPQRPPPSPPLPHRLRLRGKYDPTEVHTVLLTQEFKKAIVGYVNFR